MTVFTPAAAELSFPEEERRVLRLWQEGSSVQQPAAGFDHFGGAD
jgi:hypothetical protein